MVWWCGDHKDKKIIPQPEVREELNCEWSFQVPKSCLLIRWQGTIKHNYSKTEILYKKGKEDTAAENGQRPVPGVHQEHQRYAGRDPDEGARYESRSAFIVEISFSHLMLSFFSSIKSDLKRQLHLQGSCHVNSDNWLQKYPFWI